MSLEDHLFIAGFVHFEGHCGLNPSQVNILKDIVIKSNAKSVMEIGFNAGHSADVMLAANTNMHLTSFDLGCHPYVSHAKEYMDKTYSTRHELVLGDSTLTVPDFIAGNPGRTFDVIFIDGGHTYEIATADLANCKRLSHSKTIVILDDTMFTPGWEREYTTGPSRAWTEAIAAGHVFEQARVDFCPGMGMSYGKYLH